MGYGTNDVTQGPTQVHLAFARRAECGCKRLGSAGDFSRASIPTREFRFRLSEVSWMHSRLPVRVACACRLPTSGPYSHDGYSAGKGNSLPQGSSWPPFPARVAVPFAPALPSRGFRARLLGRPSPRGSRVAAAASRAGLLACVGHAPHQPSRLNASSVPDRSRGFAAGSRNGCPDTAARGWSIFQAYG